MSSVLVTGGAGFIGYHLIQRLLEDGFDVVAVDNLNDYYDQDLKKNRLRLIAEHPNSCKFKFLKIDISDRAAVEQLFNGISFKVVVNLAAQAGVRYSIQNPHAYVDSNLVGFVNVLEGCRHSGVDHFIYASSSSVYGMNKWQPFNVNDKTDFPISLYAATKKSNELMAHCYSHLYKMPTTGLRFFTVYGPFGRPDMAYFSFTKRVLSGEPIDVYNNGDMMRDFTYVSDIVDGIVRVMNSVPQAQDSSLTASDAPFKVYNIGNNQPITLRRFINAIETACGRKAIENLLPMQPGDVPVTFADIDELVGDTGFKPSTSIEEGISKFVKWYKDYYKILS